MQRNFPFYDGQIISFMHPDNGTSYDGIVWRVIPEDETNFTLVLRYVDEVL